ncbi:MAG: hypothetical protein LBL58_13100 [Tannerellaceae bacterium]|nr:hypothetical protein [Tannerellaceae bacterium]
MERRRIYWILVVIVLLTSCATQRVSTIVGCDYDNKKNVTNYFVLPYGSVDIPNKWERTTYNSTSKQQFFTNDEKVIIAVSFGPCNKYEFNADNSKKGFDFVKTFYKWDSEYFATDYGLNQELIEENVADNYIVWRVYGEYNNSSWDTYFLFGEKGGYSKSFSVMATEKWTREQKINFLKEMYIKKQD